MHKTNSFGLTPVDWEYKWRLGVAAELDWTGKTVRLQAVNLDHKVVLVDHAHDRGGTHLAVRLWVERFQFPASLEPVRLDFDLVLQKIYCKYVGDHEIWIFCFVAIFTIIIDVVFK